MSQHNLALLRRQLGEPLPQAEIVRNPHNAACGILPWPADSSRLRMAAVGRLEVAAKGQDLLLEVLARPAWRNRPVDISIFGEGRDRIALERLAEVHSIHNVHFKGYRRDIASLWREHHLLVLPSRYEGLPLALIEAMQCGRPAVVTDVGGNAEVVTDKIFGFVASSATSHALAEAMERAWQQRGRWPDMGLLAAESITGTMPADPVGQFHRRLEDLVSDQAESAVHALSSSFARRPVSSSR